MRYKGDEEIIIVLAVINFVASGEGDGSQSQNNMEKVNCFIRKTFDCWKVENSLELIQLLCDNGFTEIELQGMGDKIELSCRRGEFANVNFVFVFFEGFPAFVINRRNSLTWDLVILSEKDFANSEYYLD